MKTRILAVLGAALVGLIGCVSAQMSGGGQQVQKPYQVVPGPHPQERYLAGLCKERTCVSTVTVTDRCEITVDPQWMAIARENANPLLEWRLVAPPGFSFGTETIFYKPRRPEEGNPFRIERATEKVVTVQYSARDAFVRHYGIRILKDGKVCGTLDPPVMPDY
jgi:hypothetical protein